MMTPAKDDLVADAGALPRLPVALLAALWTVPALLSTLETVVFAAMNGHPMPVWRAFVGEASGWYTWALITPLIILLGRRLPLARPIRWTSIAIHAPAVLLAGAAQALVSTTIGQVIGTTSRPFAPMLRAWYLSQLPFTLIIYIAIVGLSYAWRERRRAEARERHAERLAKELVEAQLRALRMQLQPHFLFNTLNAIMALVRDVETDRAIEALSLLSDLLHTAIHAGREHETTLSDELTFIRRYLEIERVRFGDRLVVSVDLSPAVANALVPTFLLQPFVENALRHGLAARRSTGTVSLSAKAVGARLELRVSDDGVGLPPDWEARMSRGVGIANARARLAQMYGDEGVVTVSSVVAGSGTEVNVLLPLRTA
jgi:two-component system LytT family sensor kinase